MLIKINVLEKLSLSIPENSWMLELIAHMVQSGIDNGGRRLGIDRREFLYAIHIPERRSGGDRRSGEDRRSESSLRFSINVERRAALRC